MTDNYAKIVQDNLDQLYRNLPKELAGTLTAEQDGDRFVFDAFGEKCVIEPDRITLGEEEHSSVFGILISLFALNAWPDFCIPSPFRSFKEFPDSMPYVGAFKTHTEQVLVPHVPRIKEAAARITKKLKGGTNSFENAGDFSFVVYPLPKIALCYIFLKRMRISPLLSPACFQTTQTGLCRWMGLRTWLNKHPKKLYACLTRI